MLCLCLFFPHLSLSALSFLSDPHRWHGVLDGAHLLAQQWGIPNVFGETCGAVKSSFLHHPHLPLFLFIPMHVFFSFFFYIYTYFIYIYILFFYPTLVGDSQRGKRKTSEQAVLSDSNTLSERQKRMVCFGAHSLEEDLEWSEPQIKDSGVDTCSSTTLNEEHSHSDKVLTLWKPAFWSAHLVFVCSLSLIKLKTFINDQADGVYSKTAG